MNPVSRRDFLKISAAAGASFAAGALGASTAQAASSGEIPVSEDRTSVSETALPGTDRHKGRSPVIYTVAGPISPDLVNKVLPHEHLYVDFWGPTDEHYEKPLGGFERVLEIVEPYVLQVKEQGVNLIVDWAVLGVGRRVDVNQQIWADTGVYIAMATGIYKDLRPLEFADASVEQLEAFMLGEFMHGIQNTGIRPAFVKVAASPIPTPGELDIHRAAARVAAEVGCSIACHLPFPIDARDQNEIARARRFFEIVQREGVSLDRVVWGHATGMYKFDGSNFESTIAQHLEMAAQGVTIQYDAVGADPGGGPEPFFEGPTDPQLFLDMLQRFVELGYGDRVMVSEDASVYANPGGGQGGEDAEAYIAAGLPNWQYPRDIRYLYGTFASMLVERVGETAANQILRQNPVRVFSIGGSG